MKPTFDKGTHLVIEIQQLGISILGISLVLFDSKKIETEDLIVDIKDLKEYADKENLLQMVDKEKLLGLDVNSNGDTPSKSEAEKSAVDDNMIKYLSGKLTVQEMKDGFDNFIIKNSPDFIWSFNPQKIRTLLNVNKYPHSNTKILNFCEFLLDTNLIPNTDMLFKLKDSYPHERSIAEAIIILNYINLGKQLNENDAIKRLLKECKIEDLKKLFLS